MSKSKHTSGFIYIWMDKKHKRFYVGSHWGPEDDGYICSSTWMRQAYMHRPQDFKRRIIARVNTCRDDLLEEEYKWLQLIKPHEIKTRYYNLKTNKDNFWHSSDGTRMTIGQKISAKNTGRKQNFSDPIGRGKKISAAKKDVKFNEEHKAKLKAARANQVQPPEANEKRRESVRKSWELRKINKSKPPTEAVL